MNYSFRYDSNTQDCAILLDGVVIEHQPLTQTAQRLSELRNAVPTVTTTEATTKVRRSKKSRQ